MAIINIILVCIGAWFTVSFIDVLMHNLSGGTDASWNFFNILLNRG